MWGPLITIDFFPQARDCAGNGLLKVRWAATRGVLLLMCSDAMTVFDTEYGLPLATTPLPEECTPFKGWLAMDGSGTTLGTGDDGGFSILVCEHEVRCISRCVMLWLSSIHSDDRRF